MGVVEKAVGGVGGAGWSLVQAAERMEVSYRQAKRLWKRYLIGNVNFCALILRDFVADLTARRR